MIFLTYSPDAKMLSSSVCLMMKSTASAPIASKKANDGGVYTHGSEQGGHPFFTILGPDSNKSATFLVVACYLRAEVSGANHLGNASRLSVDHGVGFEYVFSEHRLASSVLLTSRFATA